MSCLGGVGEALHDVVFDRAGEEHRLLPHVSNAPGAQVVGPVGKLFEGSVRGV